jgi:hypothetical protein
VRYALLTHPTQEALRMSYPSFLKQSKADFSMRFHWLLPALLVVTTGCLTQPQTPEVSQPPPADSPTPEASAPIARSTVVQDDLPSASPSPQSTTSTAEAILTRSDTNAQVNVRATPSVTSDRLGYGLVGDRVQVIKQAASADGDDYTWYQVRFPGSGTTGWIREDFVRIRTSQIPSESPTPTQSPVD